MKKLPARQPRNRLRRVLLQPIARCQKRHRRQPQRRSQLADAVQHLLAVVPIIFRIRSLAAEAPVRRPRLIRRSNFDASCATARLRARKPETVHRNIRVADQPQRLIQRRLAALVARLAQQQNRAPEPRLAAPAVAPPPSQSHPESPLRCPRDSAATIAPTHLAALCVKRHHQMRPAVEAHQRHPMLDVPDQRVEDRIQLFVIRQMPRSRAARLHHNRQRQRLRSVSCSIRILCGAHHRRSARKSSAVSSKTTCPPFVFTSTGTSTSVDCTVNVVGLAALAMKEPPAPRHSAGRQPTRHHATNQHSESANKPHPSANSKPSANRKLRVSQGLSMPLSSTRSQLQATGYWLLATGYRLPLRLQKIRFHRNPSATERSRIGRRSSYCAAQHTWFTRSRGWHARNSCCRLLADRHNQIAQRAFVHRQPAPCRHPPENLPELLVRRRAPPGSSSAFSAETPRPPDPPDSGSSKTPPASQTESRSSSRLPSSENRSRDPAAPPTGSAALPAAPAAARNRPGSALRCWPSSAPARCRTSSSY